MAAPERTLDELDAAIYGALQVDGRRGYRSIAQELGVPEETVRFRVNRMLRDEIVQITAVINPRHLGGLLVTLLVRSAPAHRRDVAKAIDALPEAMYVSLCSGHFDLMVQVAVAGLAELEQLIAEGVGSIAGIEAVEPLIELDVIKAHYGFAGLPSPQK